MALKEKASSLFDYIIKARGQEYFYDKAVKPELVSQDIFECTVVGSRPYNVRLQWNESKVSGKYNLSLSCDCPYFGSTDVCKHLWAAILCADSTEFGIKANAIDKAQVDEKLDFSEEEDDDDYKLQQSSPVFKKPASPTKKWQTVLNEVVDKPTERWSYERSSLDPEKLRWAFYGIRPTGGYYNRDGICIELYKRERNKNGKFGAIKSFKFKKCDVPYFQEVSDQNVLKLFTALGNHFEYSGNREVIVPSALIHMILPKVLETGRAYLEFPDEINLIPLQLDPQIYNCIFELKYDEASGSGLALEACFQNENTKVPISQVTHILKDANIFFAQDTVGNYSDSGPPELLKHLVAHKQIRCGKREEDQFVQHILSLPFKVHPKIPEKLGWQIIEAQCQPVLKMRQSLQETKSFHELEVHFKYGQKLYSSQSREPLDFDKKKKIYSIRNTDQENKFINQLQDFSDITLLNQDNNFIVVRINIENFLKRITELNTSGWEIQIENRPIARNSSFDIQVTSGIDWLEVGGKIDFNGEVYTIPEILENLQKNTSWIKLRSGELGLLPEDLVVKYRILESLGEIKGDKIKFQTQQALLLDTLFKEEQFVIADQQFKDTVSRLNSFEKIKAVSPPKGFMGELREYQKDGLNWLCFLNEYRFGGCLADDMGLGKTIQVLALLQIEKRKKIKEPTLIVVPKSLIYNWLNEAKKFSPDLKITAYMGHGRRELLAEIDQFDIILVTYQTLRIDIQHFVDCNFNYIILDEAQVIKNPQSQAAKAVKLLKARHRLVMTGTPIENHIGDLLSIFQFLNPGLYANKGLIDASLKSINDQTLWILKGLRPFILRRTKEEVLKDLPQKTEQVVYCEMDPQQKTEYDNLKNFYRNKLDGTIKETGFAKSKIFVLEALLRLRQMACHPGLIDKKRGKESGGKLEILFEQLDEIIESGHKVLIFSQFTSFLEIVTQKLKERALNFAYLDGKTQNRQEQVETFQNNPQCKVFVISLKAGGVGLNLTAADYCFILDPWWNPAAESQAIDRIHRIGQKNKVFAYRLITKGTVEEKVLELQSKKKELGDALLASDQRFLSRLKLEDLQWILS